MEVIQRYQNNVEWVASLRHPLHAHSRCDMLLIDGIRIGTGNCATGCRNHAPHLLPAAWPCERRAEGVDDEE